MDQEGKKAKPIPPQPEAARKTRRTSLASIKPADGLFFFLIPSSFISFFLSFYYFFLPSFLSFYISSSYFFYLFIFELKFKKIPFSFLSFYHFYSFLPCFLPSFHPPVLTSIFFLFPQGETIKPGAVKRPELDPKRGHHNN